ncbi:uncharacterized protein PHA67_006958 isoform 2-T3 [Liasis olivaceus]
MLSSLTCGRCQPAPLTWPAEERGRALRGNLAVAGERKGPPAEASAGRGRPEPGQAAAVVVALLVVVPCQEAKLACEGPRERRDDGRRQPPPPPGPSARPRERCRRRSGRRERRHRRQKRRAAERKSESTRDRPPCAKAKLLRRRKLCKEYKDKKVYFLLRGGGVGIGIAGGGDLQKPR